MSSQQQLTCIACRQIFQNVDDQRAHYKTDLHRFNLKRKVASMPPVTEEVFQKKLAEVTPSAAEDDSKFSEECTICKKKYASRSQWEQHLTTKKHKELSLLASARPPSSTAPVAAAAPAAGPSSTSAAPSSAPVASVITDNTQESDGEVTEEQIAERIAEAKAAHEKLQCLFCRNQHKNLEKCVDHMARVHSFFIPDVEYLQDLDGLISYLREKSTVGCVCLYCDRNFQSFEAVQSHMRDLVHSKMKYDDENDDEYEDYYDFSSSYEGLLDEDEKRSPVTSEQSKENASGAVVLTGEPQDRALARLEDAVRRQVQITDDGFSIKLKDKTIGHRDLLVYYKQRPRPDRRPTEALKAVINEYKLLGYSGPQHKNYKAGESERKTSDLRAQSKYYMKLGVKKNRIQTNHSRDQTTLF